MADRMTEIRVAGLRSLADVRLPLSGLTVLIGENGSGKSALVEAFELLRKMVCPGSFVNDWLFPIHGFDGLLRSDANELTLGLRIEGDEGPLTYEVAIGRRDRVVRVVREVLDVGPLPGHATPSHVIQRDLSSALLFDQAAGKLVPLPYLGPGELALTAFGKIPPRDVGRVIDILTSGDVHVPFNVRAGWLGRELRIGLPMRAPATVQLAERLDRFGSNLTNCLIALKESRSQDEWRETIKRAREGLGADLVDIRMPPADSPGQVEVNIHFRSLVRPVPLSALSDGQLTFLGFVALTQLGRDRTFLAFDEPEQHLHPELQIRMLWMLQEAAEHHPVVIATHSDRLLDALDDPARSVVLCELDERRATRLFRPDRDALAKWLVRYSGVGALREAGYVRHAVDRAIEPVVDRGATAE